MKIVTKQQKKRTETVPAIEPLLLKKFNEFIERHKVRIARRLTTQSERVSVRTRKIMLIAFGLVVSAMSLSLIFTPAAKTPSRKTVDTPVAKHGAMVLPPGGAAAISQGDFQKMVSFMQILDSLKLHDQKTYEMIISDRKGLVDSIEYLIRYREQQK